MESLSLTRSDPKAYILAADGDFSSFSPDLDQVWSLNMEGSPTSPFCLTTTFGLTARSVSLFPNICRKNQRLTKSSPYTKFPTVTRYTPASLRVILQLMTDLDIQFDCFMPEGDVLMGTIQVQNNGQDIAELSLELALILVPFPQGIPSHPALDGITQIITACSGHLYPVLYMTGGPSAISNPYPALSKSMQIPPGKIQSQPWALVSKTEKALSIKSAREVVRTTWRRSVQSHQIACARDTIHIKTGNPDWDNAFFLAQTNAMTHWVSPGGKDHTFMLRDRNPDQAIRADQSPETLDDLTALEAQHLAHVWLPPHIEKMKRLVNNFLARVDPQGRLQVRLNASPFKPPLNECPLLANLCLSIYERDNDESFLKRVFPTLQMITDTWLTRRSTQSKSGIDLFWESPEQLQISTGLFKFDIWEETGSGLAIEFAESPALAAMLLREVKALAAIVKILHNPSAQRHYEQLANELEKKTHGFWQDQSQCFTYRDRETPAFKTQEITISGNVQKKLSIHQQFAAPQRLQVHLFSVEEGTRAGRIQLIGKNASGDRILETFNFRALRWVTGRAHFTTRHLFSSLETMLIEGMNTEDQFSVETVDFSQQDITCLLPLWSGSTNPTQVNSLLETTLNPLNPSLSYGIPETWRCQHDLPEKLPVRVNVLWNTLIIDGLERSGYPNEARDLFTNLMNSIVRGLKHFDGFYPFFDQASGHPSGQLNAIAALPPLHLFLQIAGFRLFSPTKVALWGENPFPWPVKVQWQGLSLNRDGSLTHITFPDGSIYTHDSKDAVLVTQSG